MMVGVPSDEEREGLGKLHSTVGDLCPVSPMGDMPPRLLSEGGT